jgi:3-hydroxybutyryl-CoA dehydrogenase
MVLASADRTPAAALDPVIGFFQRIGKKVSVIDDCAGMIVMRTVTMLANEGADAVLQGVCSARAVDVAMCRGVNYPLGPLAWANRIGVDRVCEVLDNLRAHYGEDRYRCSPLLRRTAWRGGDFDV